MRVPRNEFHTFNKTDRRGGPALCRARARAARAAGRGRRVARAVWWYASRVATLASFGLDRDLNYAAHRQHSHSHSHSHATCTAQPPGKVVHRVAYPRYLLPDLQHGLSEAKE